MGIRGLSTYIARHSDKYLEPYQLRCCTVIIDGNSIACYLYSCLSKCNCAFGGDYDRYAYCVDQFFTLLEKCEITPVVIFDGGYESKKLRAVFNRYKKKLEIARTIHPLNQSKRNNFPLFMKDTFMNVMRKHNISFAQCDFEADGEIAAIARRLGCPVMSLDSDFYIFDVLYIPLSSVVHVAEKYSSPSKKGISYFINCKIYRIESFLNSLGGLDKDLLPVLAAVLGNDYIDRRTMNKFLAQISIPKRKKMTRTEKLVIGLLEWLKNETFETAISKILNRFKNKKRRFMRKQLQKIISGYTNVSSELLPFLGDSQYVIVDDPSPKISWLIDDEGDEDDDDDVIIEDEEEEEEEELVMKEDDDDVTIEEEEEEELVMKGDVCDDDIEEEEPVEEKIDDDVEVLTEDEESFDQDNYANYSNEVDNAGNTFKLSENILGGWFRESFRQGYLPEYFMNMIFLKIHFLKTQAEDYSKLFSHYISLPILQVILGILTSGWSKCLKLKCIVHNKNGRIQTLVLTPVYETRTISTFPLLKDVPTLPLSVKESLIYDCLGFDSCHVEVVNMFPDDWKMFIMSLVYWVNNISERKIATYVHSLLFSAIALNVVGKHIGYCRFNRNFLRKHFNQPKKKNDVVNSDKEKESNKQSEPQNFTDITVAESLVKVSRDDCLQTFHSVYPFYMINETLQSRPKLYSFDVIHVFAQFQSCLLTANHLNALLNFPFPSCHIEEFYSGTLIYNAYMNFTKRSDVENYILLHLLKSASLRLLYRNIFNKVSKMISSSLVMDVEKRRNQRKKKKKCKATAEDVVTECGDNVEIEDNEITEFLRNNRFCALNFADDC